MQSLEYDVFVVGAGPTGLATAALLAREGVKVAAITRYSGLANSPRAHIINQRTMEVFRDLGIEEQILAEAMPAGLMGQVIWAESFAGAEIARRKGWGAGASRKSDYAAASPCDPTNIPQHVLEPLLRDAAEGYGAEVLHNLELISIAQHDDRVISICRNRLTGEEIEVSSKYAVGADGDNSTVCRELGFEVEGVMGLGHMLNYWIEADLSSYTAHRPGALYQIFRPGGAGFVDNAMFVNVRPWSEWVISIPYDPPTGDPDRSEEAAIQIARKYVGDDSLEVRLIGTSTWTINQVHAEIMHQGRVVIAGNAAHRHPPAGGLGANTCVQDAFNLAWKLRALLDGTGGDGLLETYSSERAPVARQIVESANRSLSALMAIPGALGLRPGQTEEEGRASLRSRFEDSPRGAAGRKALAEALKLQDFNFNALGVELAHRYNSTAITSDGTTFTPTLDEALFYEPSTVPGSPLPHAWVTRGVDTLSTLDLTGKGQFTLITGIGGEAWRATAAEASRALRVPVSVVAIGPGLDIEDPCGDWAELRGTTESGALLVRPDQHIAFRAQGSSAQALGSFHAALKSALGLAVSNEQIRR